MYDCWRQNLKGGLKVVERLLGIKRQLTGVDGYIAVQLWYDYVNNNNKEALPQQFSLSHRKCQPISPKAL